MRVTACPPRDCAPAETCRGLGIQNFRSSGVEVRASDFGLRISGFGFRDSGFEFRVPGSKFRVAGLGSRGSCRRLRVQGFGVWVSGSGVWGVGSGKVDMRLPGKGDSKSHGARPVHQIISMIEWIWTSRLSIKNSLPLGS